MYGMDPVGGVGTVSSVAPLSTSNFSMTTAKTSMMMKQGYDNAAGSIKAGMLLTIGLGAAVVLL